MNIIFGRRQNREVQLLTKSGIRI